MPRCALLVRDALTLLKEQEEQKRKWLQAISDNQLAVSPTGHETKEELARKTGEWNGLQMAWNILKEGR
jgi:Arc/MetJ-type ribon-helix-helix transcriptional regulator